LVNQRTLLAYPQRQNRNLFDLSYLKLPSDSPKPSVEAYMRTMNRLEQPFRGATTLQEQINRIFGDGLGRTGEESNLTPWAPAVDIYETENELVVKADLPDVNPQDLDIRVENNILTIRGDRKFEKQVHEDNYLRIERAYGSFSRSFSLANSVNSEAIQADYQNGVLTLSLPKREEAKPKQIKVNVGTQSGTRVMAASAGSPGSR
jgi:HSP20 family protein